MGKRLENICESLLELLQKGKCIDEEHVHIFLDSAVDCLDGETDEDKPQKLGRLAAYVQKKWQYREIDSMTSEQAFLCGGIWGGIKLLGMARERNEKSVRLEVLKKQYAGYYDFFHAIATEPGIKHKELAEKCGKSASLLSQFAAGVKREGLIVCRPVGREKYYYLRPLGTQVYDALRWDRQENEKKLYMRQWSRKNLPNSSYKERYNEKDELINTIMDNRNICISDRSEGMLVEDNDEFAVAIW